MKDNNEIPSFLVPLFLAKQLKRIGFDEKTIFFYSFDNCAKGLRSHSEPYNMNCSQFFEGAYVSLPTWEQVIEWFIDKNLIGTIEYRKFDEKDPYYAYCITNKMTKVLDYSSNTTRYKTYREAREALVNKLIELYGKK